jgi:hypothetical protein
MSPFWGENESDTPWHLFYFILFTFFFFRFSDLLFYLFFCFFGWGEEEIISKCPLRLGKKNVACDVFIHNVFIRTEIIEREKNNNREGGIG